MKTSEGIEFALDVVVDQRMIIAPRGSFVGVPTNVPAPEIGRTANGDLYIKSENQKLYKSTDSGRTWTSQPIDLSAGLKVIGIPTSGATGPVQALANFGITSGDRFWLVHRSDPPDSRDYSDGYGGKWKGQQSPNFFISHSNDYGGSWISQQIDATSLHPPGGAQYYRFVEVIRGPVMELANGTIQFSISLFWKNEWTNPWPPATPMGSAMLRSTDGGVTWGDPTFLRLPDSYVFESDYAIDPRDPNHILAITRVQRPLLPDENEAQTRAQTGSPDSNRFVYKNGMLMESTDAGRSFQAVEGGLLGYYEYRNSIAWASNGVIALLSQGNASSMSNPDAGKVLVRLSLDHGQKWFAGGEKGNPHVGDPSVVEFVLHSPDVFGDGHQHYALGMSSTIHLGDNRFLTVFGNLVDTGDGIENAEMAGVIWHIEGKLVPKPVLASMAGAVDL